MSAPGDLVTFVCASGFTLGNCYFAALSLWAILRTHLWFFHVWFVCAILGIVLALVNTALYYDPPFLPHLLGRQLYRLFFYSYTWLLLANFVVTLVASTFLVRWICFKQRVETSQKT